MTKRHIVMMMMMMMMIDAINSLWVVCSFAFCLKIIKIKRKSCWACFQAPPSSETCRVDEWGR